MTPDSDSGTKRAGDDSGEIALEKAQELEAVVLGHPEDATDAGVLGHLTEIDHALFRRKLSDTAVVALLGLAAILLAAASYLTVQRSHDIGRLRATADRIEQSEVTNQALNRQMIEQLARLEGAIGRAEEASTLVADYVRQAQAAAAAGQGQSAAVVRGLTQIERLVVGIEELLGRPLPPATSETPTSSPTGG